MKELEVCGRLNGMMFNMGKYFCGMHPTCRVVSRERVEMAKRHIDEEYEFIGMAEEFERTILLLEWMLPNYFKGASAVWKGISKMHDNTKTIKRDFLTVESKRKLRNYLMKDEYEVYYHAKKKFEQLKAMYRIS